MQTTGPEKNPTALWAVGIVLVLTLVATTSTARAAWTEIARFLSLTGKPEPASANVLSEHHLEGLDSMPPQAQAEFLLKILAHSRHHKRVRIHGHYLRKCAHMSARICILR